MTGRCTKKEGKRAKAERSKKSRETQTGGQKKCKRGGTQKKIKLIRRSVKKLTTDLPHLCSWLHKLCILLFQILSIMPHSFDCPSLPAQFSVPLSLPCKRHSLGLCSPAADPVSHLPCVALRARTLPIWFFLNQHPKSLNTCTFHKTQKAKCGLSHSVHYSVTEKPYWKVQELHRGPSLCSLQCIWGSG